MHNERHCLSGVREKTSRVHMKNSGRPFICFVRRVWVRIGHCLLHDDTCANGNEVASVTVDKGVIVDLVLSRIAKTSPT